MVRQIRVVIELGPSYVSHIGHSPVLEAQAFKNDVGSAQFRPVWEIRVAYENP